MNKKFITIEVDTDASVVIEGHGFSGPECAKATKFLEDALGAVVETKRKREFTERPVVNRTQDA